MSFALVASAHEGGEADKARSEHLVGVNWAAPWISRALVVGGIAVVGVAVVGVAVYTMQSR